MTTMATVPDRYMDCARCGGRMEIARTSIGRDDDGLYWKASLECKKCSYRSIYRTQETFTGEI